jgi:hypothetical protein
MNHAIHFLNSQTDGRTSFLAVSIIDASQACAVLLQMTFPSLYPTARPTISVTQLLGRASAFNLFKIRNVRAIATDIRLTRKPVKWQAFLCRFLFKVYLL